MAGYESFHIAPEASIPYKITGEDGTVAVLNDPADPNFVGYLDGEDALSGIDSPEIRDSFAEMSEADGSWAGQSFYTRRPIVMNGRVIPTSAADRNAKLGRLMRACTARFSDGILEWTPSGSNGEPVFLRFRTQLPFRAKGGFNKQFQIGLVANDPRIYTKRVYLSVNNTVPGDYKSSYYKLTGGTVGSPRFQQSLALPAGTWDVRYYVRPATAGGTAQLTVSGTGVTAVTNPTTALTPANEWKLAELQFTLPAAATVTVQLRSASATTYISDCMHSSIQPPKSTLVADQLGQYCPIRVGAATLAGESAVGSGVNQPYTAFNPGNAEAPLGLSVVGAMGSACPVARDPKAGFILAFAAGYSNPGWLNVPNTLLSAVHDTGGASIVGQMNPAYTLWSELLPGDNWVLLNDYGGTTAINGTSDSSGTILCTRWRGTFL